MAQNSDQVNLEPITLKLLQTKHRDAIMQIAEECHADISVFGSVARGDNRPDSDIDFLVHMRPGARGLDLGGVQYMLEKLFPGYRIDVIPDSSLHWYIKDRVLQEAVKL